MKNDAGDREIVLYGSLENPDRIGTTRAVREEYALLEAPPTWRYKWGTIVLSLLGGGTAAVFLATPAQLASSVGIVNVLVGLVVAMIIQTTLNYFLIRAASDSGLGTELLSRGLGFGFYGSAWTTLLYWVSWVIFFGSEAQVMGDSLASVIDIPNWVCYLIVGAAFIPLVLYGVGFIEKFQKWTLALFVIGYVVLIVVTLTRDDLTERFSNAAIDDWGSFGIIPFLGVMGAYFGLIGNIALGHADMGRLGKNSSSLRGSNGKRGVFALSFIPYSFVAYILLGVLGIVFWMSTGDPNPGSYSVAILGNAGFLLILVTQLRINLVNAYSGSIALSNFFSRYRLTPGRSIFAVVTVILGTALAFGDVLGRLSVVLTILGIFFMAWLGVLVPRLIILRRTAKMQGVDDVRIEYRRARVLDYDSVGLGAVAVASLVGLVLYFGGKAGHLGGEVTQNISSLVAFMVATCFVVMAACLAGRYTSQRTEAPAWPRDDAVVECPIEHEVVATRSMVACPFHGKWISSQACIGTVGCGQVCLSASREELLDISLPPRTSYLAVVNEGLRDAER